MPISPPPNAAHVFHGTVFDIWQWDQERFDGSHATYECLTRQDAAHVIAFLNPHTIILAEQEQPGRPPFLDIPGGRVDEGETPETTARREFKEETGYDIGKLELFRRIDFRGYQRFSSFLYLATDLKNGSLQHLDAGEKIAVKPTPFDDAVRLSLSDGLRQSYAMLAILSLRYNEDARRKLETFLASAP